MNRILRYLSRLLCGLSITRVAWTTAIAAVAAFLASRVFENTFLDLLVSALCVSYTIMILFTVAQNIAHRWLPREAAEMLAVLIGSAVGTLIAGWVKGRTLEQMLGERLWGVVATGSIGIGFGCVIVGIYIYREQRAQSTAERARAEVIQTRLEKEVLVARLQLLQAQVEPHFLFNTLANVQHLVETDPPTAARMLDSLIRYLRASLPQMRERATTLRRELDMVRAYLEVQAVRMGHRLRFEIDADERLLDLPYPPMMLISLVENAVRHGIDAVAGGGTVTIRASATAEALSVAIADTGAGLSEHGALGVGLTNIRERLETLYGNSGRLELTENVPQGVVVTVAVPYAPTGVA